MMDIFSIDNVLGGSYTQINLSYEIKEILNIEIKKCKKSLL